MDESDSVDQEIRVRDPHSPHDFRSVLGTLPTGVSVISGMVDRRPIGVVVGSLVSVSLDPPLIGFFIGAGSTSWPLIEPTGQFGVSILSDAQTSVSRAFTHREGSKFEGCDWEPNPRGNPRISDAVAWLDCAIDQLVPAGDHVLVLGAVEAMGNFPAASPLVFLGGKYGRFSAEGMG